jgi:hypothetical protein
MACHQLYAVCIEVSKKLQPATKIEKSDFKMEFVGKLWWLNIYKIRAFRSLDGVVDRATRYGLEGPGIESRLEEKFSAPTQTASEAHPASCIMSTRSFPG